MEKSNNSSMSCVILDSDVLVSWLTQEKETKTEKELWKTPLKIITLIDKGEIKGCVCIVSIMEIRFLLRRKKRYTEDIIRSFFKDFPKVFEIIIPNEVELLKADHLQDKFLLDPFDAILFATALTRENVTLISRDNAFIKVASKLLRAVTPEEFLDKYLLNSSI